MRAVLWVRVVLWAWAGGTGGARARWQGEAHETVALSALEGAQGLSTGTRVHTECGGCMPSLGGLRAGSASLKRGVLARAHRVRRRVRLVALSVALGHVIIGVNGLGVLSHAPEGSSARGGSARWGDVVWGNIGRRFRHGGSTAITPHAVHSAEHPMRRDAGACRR